MPTRRHIERGVARSAQSVSGKGTAFTRQRNELCRERQELPWVKVESAGYGCVPQEAVS